ncbi:MAG TPA: helix-turn-helix domain-containing protein [Gemmatimonadaceae bacterium]|nr:helix-turn-helix domain-containing protein [Gemmatimonadaceae bacterium]
MLSKGIDTLDGRRVRNTREWAGLHAFEAQYEPKASLAEHEHAEPFFTYVLRGNYTENARGIPRECSAGSVIIHPPGDTHWNSVGHHGTVSLNVQLSPDLWDFLGSSAEAHDITGRVLSGDIQWAAIAVWREFHRDDDASALALSESVAVLCSSLVVTHQRSTLGISRRLDATAELIGDCRERAPTLSKVAAQVGVHPMYLAKLFRRRFGCSLGEFVRRRRVAWACNELANRDRTISSIAAEAGFADHAHFTRTFRRLTGCTPAWWRAHLP